MCKKKGEGAGGGEDQLHLFGLSNCFFFFRVIFHFMSSYWKKWSSSYILHSTWYQLLFKKILFRICGWFPFIICNNFINSRNWLQTSRKRCNRIIVVHQVRDLRVVRVHLPLPPYKMKYLFNPWQHILCTSVMMGFYSRGRNSPNVFLRRHACKIATVIHSHDSFFFLIPYRIERHAHLWL